MESVTLRADSTRRKRRSFSLPSFRKPAAEQERSVNAKAAAEQEEAAARVRRAAAWQWYTRGLGETIVPTTAPAVAAGAARRRGAEAVGACSGGETVAGRPPLRSANPLTSSSRFRTEASAAGRAGVDVLPAARLYDDVDLSGLKTQMSSFVERLRQKPNHTVDRRPPPIKTDGTSADDSRPQPPPRRPPPKEQAHVRRSSLSSAASDLSSGLRAPVSALHRLYRKILPRCFHPGKYKTVSKLFGEPVAADDEEPETGDVQHHYHSYIHHHHYHHHHYRPASFKPEGALSTPRPRRFSESSGIRGRIPSSIYETSDDFDSEDEETVDIRTAVPALRRRNSDSSLPDKYDLMKAIGNVLVSKVERPSAGKEEPMSPRRQNSERYTINFMKGILQDERRQKSADREFRRRHSTESVRYLDAYAMEEAGRAASGGSRAGAHGVYKLSTDGNPSANYECRQTSRRRHSASYVEACRQAEGLVVEVLQKRDGEENWLRMPLQKNPPFEQRGRVIGQRPVYGRQLQPQPQPQLQRQRQKPPARVYSLSYDFR